ncbi:MAG: 30S ribosomal protein S3 [Thermoproteota archaeon]|nr:MAG: 30S ribosomal protein S3 [Candidatus Korarchaeota archaeon]
MSERAKPVYKRIVEEGWLKARLQEFFESTLRTAGFHKVDVVKTPIREVVTIYADRPGIAIGKGGKRIKEITESMRREFGFKNPYLRIEKVEEPFLSAQIVANYIARRILKGERHRRVAFAALRRVMMAGAEGVEIRISGKFGKRAREDRFRAGVIYRCGGDYLENVEYAVRNILLPQGSMGIRVRIAKPGTRLPGKPTIKEEEIEKILAEISPREEETEEEVSEEVIAEEEKISEEVEENAKDEGGGTEKPEQGGA